MILGKEKKNLIKNFIVFLTVKFLHFYHSSKIITIFLFPYYILGFFSSKFEATLVNSKFSIFLIPAVYFNLKKYYDLFLSGDVVKAYSYKINAVYLCYLLSNERRKMEVLTYLKLLNKNFFLKEFLAQDKIDKIIINEYSNSSFNFFEVNPFIKSKNSITLVGAKLRFSDIECFFTKNDTVLMIKPYDLKKAEFKLYAYYNFPDFKVKFREISELYKRGLVNKVFTPFGSHLPFVFSLPRLNRFKLLISPFSMINVVNYLLISGFGKIYLKGFDFYMGDSIYLKDYYSGLKDDDNKVDHNKFMTSMARHDILLNYMLLKELVSMDNIDVDDMLAYVKDMSAKEYLKKFEEKYGG